jgi:hypothetical protein
VVLELCTVFHEPSLIPVADKNFEQQIEKIGNAIKNLNTAKKIFQNYSTFDNATKLNQRGK